MTARLRHRWTDIRDAVHARVLNGTYRAGDKLPRDEDLAAELGCSRSTMQRAMQDLSDSGLLERRRRGGTHVRADPVTRARLDIPIVRREVEGIGAVYGYRLRHRAYRNAPREVLNRLRLEAPRKLLRVEALHLADGAPYIAEDRWVCPETVPGILDLDLSEQSANEWLVRNTPYSRCDLAVTALQADAPAASALHCAPGAALLAIDRTTWIDAAPITTVRSICRPGYRLLTSI
ncbi:MAG: GntR family transcriptional regulator [Pseudomonadota bacterium]